jgi:ActR/RegA family two-component response regulator
MRADFRAPSDLNSRERNMPARGSFGIVGHLGRALGGPGRRALRWRLLHLPGRIWSLLLGSRPGNGDSRAKNAYAAPHCEVLLASADPQSRQVLASVLSQWGLELICSSTVSNTNAILARRPVPLLFCEERLADGTFRDVLGAAKLMKSRPHIVVSSPMDGENPYCEAIRLGAFDVIPFPCRAADVQRVVSHSMRQERESPDRPTFGDADDIKFSYGRWRASELSLRHSFLGLQ